MAGLTGQSDIDRVRDAVDLAQLVGEHIPLRRSGREHIGLCPFHDDHKPSFHVVTHKGAGFYKCFSCNAAGDVFKFVQNYLRMDFAESLRFLAERAGIALTDRATEEAGGRRSRRNDLRDVTGRAAAFFQRNLAIQSVGHAARQVIADRRISEEMVRSFMLGCAADSWDALDSILRKKPEIQSLAAAVGLLKRRSDDPASGFYDAFRNRLIFPICDESGHPIAFGGRIINPEDQPKYINSSESEIFSKSQVLYGLHLARRSIIDLKYAIVVEGYVDVIACHQFSISNVVGTLGTALTQEHARSLSRLCDTVVLVFDPDAAGQRAADRAMEVFFNSPVDVRICTLPDGLDPDELLHTENGLKRFQHAVDTAPDALTHRIERLRRQLAVMESVAARQNILNQFLANLGELGFAKLEGLRKRDALTRLSGATGLSIDELQRAMPARRARVMSLNSQDAGDAGRTEAGGAASVSLVSVLPARRRAEHDLLGLLIYKPELAQDRVELRGGSAGSVIEVLDAFEFADAEARVITRCIVEAHLTAGEFSVPKLMDVVAAKGGNRDVVASLYFAAERRMESESNRSGSQWLAAMFDSLQDQMSHEQYRQQLAAMRADDSVDKGAVPADALQIVIRERRKLGPFVAAIPTGVRQ